MDDAAHLARAIRINTAGGVLALSGFAVTMALVVAGVMPWGLGAASTIGMMAVIGSLQLVTAWGLRRDRDDPAGRERRERRFVSAVVAWGAVLLLGSLLLVAGIIAWGLLR
jgi:hypothetical protein